MPKLLHRLLGLTLVLCTGALVSDAFGSAAGIAAAIFMLMLVSLDALMNTILEQLKLMNEELIKRLK